MGHRLAQGGRIESMTPTSPWLVVGLGNPGAEYASTRHNVGHLSVDVLQRRCGETWSGHRTGTHIVQARLGILPGGAPGPKVILAKSDSYMNTLGGPIGRLMRFFDVPAERLLVIHDDLDLPPQELRLKFGGGEGGHNGLKSISQVLGTKNYHRLRIGIGRPPGRMEVVDFVLSTIPSKERPEWEVTFEETADLVESIVTCGFAHTQQELHSKNASTRA